MPPNIISSLMPSTNEYKTVISGADSVLGGVLGGSHVARLWLSTSEMSNTYMAIVFLGFGGSTGCLAIEYLLLNFSSSRLSVSSCRSLFLIRLD